MIKSLLLCIVLLTSINLLFTSDACKARSIDSYKIHISYYKETKQIHAWQTRGARTTYLTKYLTTGNFTKHATMESGRNVFRFTPDIETIETLKAEIAEFERTLIKK